MHAKARFGGFLVPRNDSIFYKLIIAQLPKYDRARFAIHQMSGEKEVLSVSIDPSAVDASDVETLQDLVLAALRDASRQVDEAVRQKTSAMLGGMLPGMR